MFPHLTRSLTSTACSESPNSQMEEGRSLTYLLLTFTGRGKECETTTYRTQDYLHPASLQQMVPEPRAQKVSPKVPLPRAQIDLTTGVQAGI